MARPRVPLSPAKVRRTRLLLAVATAVAAVGSVVDAATGHGVWLVGIAGWAAVVVAVGLGAGSQEAPGIVGLESVAARWRTWWRDREEPRNDADWS